MQSKMTEREFVESEAGLEFAPEPLPVAPVLVNLNGRATFSGFHAWERSSQGDAPFDVPETYALGILRYNAYPSLRAAAERVRLASILPAGALPAGLNLALCELVAELAKGPK